MDSSTTILTDHRPAPGPSAGSRVSLPSRLQGIQKFLPLILLPFLLTVIDDSWTFLAPTGFIDSYVYTGYFLDLQNLRTFAHTYYSSRLPWILVGHLAYTLASPEIANLFLRFFLFYLGTFSLYVVVRSICKNHAAALLAAVLLGVHTHFLYAIHWDYGTGAALTTLLVAFACLARSTRAARPGPLLVASGFAAVVALSIHIFIILLLPGLGLWYAWTDGPPSRGRWFKGVILLGSGAALAFLLLGAISMSFGSDFNYLRPQIHVAGALDTSPWRHSNREWVEFAIWLAFPTIAVLVSAVVFVVVLSRRLRNLPLDPAVETLAPTALTMLVTAAVFLFVELRRGLALEERFYASFLIPYTFAVLGAGISVSMSRQIPNGWLRGGIMPAALALSIGSFVAASFRILPGCTPACSLWGPTGVAALGAVAGIALSLASRNALVVVFALALMAIVNAAPDGDLLVRQQRDIMHDRFLMVYDANAALQPYNHDGELRFWYNRNESLGPTFLGIASLHLWGYRLISDLFPSLIYPQSGTESPVAGRTIALLTQDDDALWKADDTLQQKGQRAEVLFRRRVQRRDQSFNVFVIKVVPSGPSIDLSSRKFQPVAGTVASADDGSIRITGAATPWAYAAVLRLPPQPTLDGVSPIYVNVRLIVSGGPVGVGVLTSDGRAFIDQQEVSPTTVLKDIYLQLPALETGRDLVIRTLSRPLVSNVRVESVTLSRVKPN